MNRKLFLPIPRPKRIRMGRSPHAKAHLSRFRHPIRTSETQGQKKSTRTKSKSKGYTKLRFFAGQVDECLKPFLGYQLERLPIPHGVIKVPRSRILKKIRSEVLYYLLKFGLDECVLIIATTLSGKGKTIVRHSVSATRIPKSHYRKIARFKGTLTGKVMQHLFS